MRSATCPRKLPLRPPAEAIGSSPRVLPAPCGRDTDRGAPLRTLTLAVLRGALLRVV
ncbi:hypothetical protein ABZ621_27430 [Streptomyces sp. NPDC007863]|uniref:hypothetical protein n=1 Tax=Streptomyces sp. NPDC007863 TaxID=3154894 RepID=UPI0033CB0B29